ncbi:MAG TPA: efflux RND transporter periplasmic adaptor subunit [Gallionellaceae bacterium]|nr:efflux RND transporter periplasmic adaptor subunit [Gallionellaceae bacterium]
MPVPPFLRHLLHHHTAIAVAVIAAAIVTLVVISRPKAIPVALYTVARGTVEATVSNTRAGTVKACRRSKMSPAAGGQIAQLLVQKGQRVKKGEVLLRLWSKDLQAQDRLAHDQLATAEAQVRQACEQADLAVSEAQRAHQLQAQGFLSPQGMEQKDTAAEVARAGCHAARTQVAQAQARIALARADIDRMTLRAPFDGIIADISGEQGEFATPSPPGIPTPPAIDLIDDSCMYVSAPIDEVDAARVQVGQQARITLDAVKGRVFPGKVRRIAPYVLELEKQARTVEVDVEFTDWHPPANSAAPGQPGQAPAASAPVTSTPAESIPIESRPLNLLVGYSADVEIVYDRHPGVLRIPTQALLEGNKVLLYGPKGVLEARKVQTGLANWEETEITGGLKAGDRIVLSLDRPGVKAGVRVVPEKAKN